MSTCRSHNFLLVAQNHESLDLLERYSNFLSIFQQPSPLKETRVQKYPKGLQKCNILKHRKYQKIRFWYFPISTCANIIYIFLDYVLITYYTDKNILDNLFDHLILFMWLVAQYEKRVPIDMFDIFGQMQLIYLY